MSSINVLRDEYPGNGAWGEFVDVFRPAWNDITDQASYLSVIADEEIALVLAVSMGRRALDWFNLPCRALGGEIPSNVLSKHRSGLQILRSLLMRMPR